MGKIGIGQILVIFALFIIFFGYKNLPGLGKNLGRALRNFKQSVEEQEEVDIIGNKKQ